MPRTLRVPFDVSSRGSIAITDDPVRIVEQQMLDIITTNYGERPMRPQYGANLRSLLFRPIDRPMLANAANRVKELLGIYVTIAEILSVVFAQEDSNSSQITVTVLYRLIPDSTILTMHKTLSGLVSEETSI